MNELFVNPKWFTATFPADTTVLNPDRYHNKKMQLYGILAELHELIPEGYWHYMETVAFSKLFVSAADSYLCQIILMVCHGGAKLIFEKYKGLSEYYKYSYNEECGKMAEFKNTIQWPNSEPKAGREKSKSKCFFLPLHFPNEKQNLTKLFKVKWISSFLQASLFGVSTIESAALNDPDWKPDTQSSSNGNTDSNEHINNKMAEALKALDMNGKSNSDSDDDFSGEGGDGGIQMEQDVDILPRDHDIDIPSYPALNPLPSASPPNIAIKPNLGTPALNKPTLDKPNLDEPSLDKPNINGAAPILKDSRLPVADNAGLSAPLQSSLAENAIAIPKASKRKTGPRSKGSVPAQKQPSRVK
ncbi:hypothetical protein EST38_g12363 [Candolleomyces aberdarensis]|uniref:Uncharacterized protein n=1 Tax=Candolleomyces aberdarensis TaxID=2316362 RepID=A0A4Q2D2M0_9AGAR|nr:hypothetical protein EST38_g12363 [Candolleomyces aberdarensis]